MDQPTDQHMDIFSYRVAIDASLSISKYRYPLKEIEMNWKLEIQSKLVLILEKHALNANGLVEFLVGWSLKKI